MAKRGLFSCFDRALEDEPVFELLARDPSFGRLVRGWADEREAAINAGDRPAEDVAQVREARMLALEGERWRRDHLYAWRREPVPLRQQVRVEEPVPDPADVRMGVAPWARSS